MNTIRLILPARSAEPAVATLWRAAALVIGALALIHLLGVPEPTGWVLLALVVAGATVRASAADALAVALGAWLLGTGFLTHADGVLTLDVRDGLHLAAVLAGAAAGALAGRAGRGRRR